MIGPLNMIKMNVLPNLYLFRSLPLPLPKQLFDELTHIFYRSICNNKKPRLRLCFKSIDVHLQSGSAAIILHENYYKMSTECSRYLGSFTLQLGIKRPEKQRCNKIISLLRFIDSCIVWWSINTAWVISDPLSLILEPYLSKSCTELYHR